MKKTFTIISSVIFMLICSAFTVFANETGTDTADTANENVTVEKITDLEEVKGLISDYIEKENFESTVRISEVYYDTKGNEYYFIHIKTYEWEIDKIKNFISESNIDESIIDFYVVDIALVNPSVVKGDANKDGFVNIRDCAFIASKLAMNDIENLPEESDYNEDDSIDVRDAAAIASDLAKR